MWKNIISSWSFKKALMIISLSGMTAVVGAQAWISGASNYFSLSANHENLIYNLGDTALLRVTPLVTPEPTTRMVFEAFFQGQPAELQTYGRNLVLTQSLSAYGNHVFNVKAFIENAELADSLKASLQDTDRQLAEIQDQIAAGGDSDELIREQARLQDLKTSLQGRLNANHHLVQEKSITLSVPNPVPTVKFTLAEQNIFRNRTEPIVVQAELSQAATTELHVPLTVGGSMPSAGYSSVPAGIVFPAGTSTQSISFSLTSSATANQTIALTLGSATGVVIGAPAVHTVNVGADAIPTIDKLRISVENAGAPYYVQIKAVGLTAATTGIEALEFNFGDGKVITMKYWQYIKLGIARHLYTQGGSYTIGVTPLGEGGTPGETVTESINLFGTGEVPYGPLQITESSTPGGLHIDASAVVDPGSEPIADYLWFFADGDEISGPDASVLDHVFPEGYSTMSFRASTNEQRRNQVKLQIHSDGVHASVVGPVLVLRHQTLVGGAPFVANFDASDSFSMSGQILRTAWDFGDGVRAYDRHAETPSASHTYTNPGVYSPLVRIYDSNGMMTSQYLTVVVTGSQPQTASAKILAYRTSIINDFQYSFVGTSLGFGGLIDPAMTFWDFGDGARYFNSRGAVNTFTQGTHSVHMDATDVYGQPLSETVDLTVGPGALVPSFIMSTSGAVTGQSTPISFVNSSDASSAKYSLNYDDGSATENGNFVDPMTKEHVYGAPDIYMANAVLTNSENRSSGFLTSPVYVWSSAPPILAATANAYVGEAPFSIQLDSSTSRAADGGLLSYYWEVTGAGQVWSSSLDSHLNLTLYNPGLYYAQAFVRDLTGNFQAKYIRIQVVPTGGLQPPGQDPIPDFTASENGDGSTSFDASASVLNADGFPYYQWDYGDGMKDAQMGTQSSHNYEQPGSYEVTLKVFNGKGKSAEITKTVVVGSRKVGPWLATPRVTSSPVISSDYLNMVMQSALQHEIREEQNR